MALFEIKAEELRPIQESSFAVVGLKERTDIQRLLRTQIDVVSPETMIVLKSFATGKIQSAELTFSG